MKKIVKIMVILSSILVLAACGSSKDTDTKNKVKSNSKMDIEYLSDLSTEINQYWLMDGSYQGERITSLNDVSWETEDKNQCFTMRDKNEALFGTMKNNEIVYAVVYSVGKLDENGFYPLKQTKSIASQTYFNEKIKNKEDYDKAAEVKFSHTVPNETYMFSTTDISKETLYLRFYKEDGVLYREEFDGKDKEILYRYSK